MHLRSSPTATPPVEANLSLPLRDMDDLHAAIDEQRREGDGKNNQRRSGSVLSKYGRTRYSTEIVVSDIVHEFYTLRFGLGF